MIKTIIKLSLTFNGQEKTFKAGSCVNRRFVSLNDNLHNNMQKNMAGKLTSAAPTPGAKFIALITIRNADVASSV